MAEGDERRSTRRFHSEILVRCGGAPRKAEVTAEELDQAPPGAETRDMSIGGCKLRSADPLPRGAELVFDLKLDDHVMTVRGVVRRVTKVADGYEAGVEFQGLEPFERDGLALYLLESGAEPEDEG